MLILKVVTSKCMKTLVTRWSNYYVCMSISQYSINKIYKRWLYNYKKKKTRIFNTYWVINKILKYKWMYTYIDIVMTMIIWKKHKYQII